MGNLLSVLIHDGRINSNRRQCARTRNGWRGTGQRRDHVATRLGLPPRINDWTTLVTNHTVVPHPRFWVDGLAHRAQDLQ